MSRDFYVVLGISPEADLNKIKSAYRKLVKLYHPDTSPQPVEKFLEVRDAYEQVLMEKCQQEESAAGEEPEAQSADGPLVVDRSARPAPRAQGRGQRRPLDEQVAGRFTELDEFFSGWIPGLFPQGRSAPRRKDLYVELVLAPAEARAGGMIPLRIPIEDRCPGCDGLPSGMIPCPTCRGRGRIVDYHPIEVSVPPGVEDGTRARIDLGDISLPGTRLNVLVTIER